MYGTPPPAPYPAFYPPPHPQKRRGFQKNYWRYLCCCCSYIFLILLINFFTGLYLYIAYRPQVPDFKIKTVNVNAFEIKPDSTLVTDFDVSVRVENPNRNIGVLYGGDDSDVIFYYDRVAIAAGKLAIVRQGRENTTVLVVNMKGNAAIGPETQRSLTAVMENKNTMVVAMMIRVPLNVFVADYQTRRFKLSFHGLMAFNPSLPNNTAGIISSTYVVKF